MAGHSKWANIQHRKGAQDKKRGKLFSKLIRELTVAARMGGPDPDTNPRLRLAYDKALSSNMSKDTMERAIKRGAGGQEGATLEEVLYEGYGPSGVAVLVHCMTDNKKRTVSEVRYAFTKCGGNLGTDGSVSYLFKKQGIITFPSGSDEDKIMGVAIEEGADDVITNDDGSIDVMTSYESFITIKNALDAAGLQYDHAEVTDVASTTIPLDAAGAEKMFRMLDMLEDLDDVQSVSSNADVPDDVLEALK